MTAAPAHPGQAEIWRQVARAIEPRARQRPSRWAEANVVLTSEQSARTGPFRCSWKPWTAALHDAAYDHPAKRGVIGIKPAQVGWSQATINLLLCLAETEPGPFLYVTTDDKKAKEFCELYFMPTIARSPRLRALFDVADRSELKFHKPYHGGVVDFGGAGTESTVISTPRRVVVLDEYEKSSANFSKTGGDLFGTALERLSTFRDVSLLLAYGHPRHEGQDIDKLWSQESDRRRWVFDCPRCGGTVEPLWARVEFAGAVGPEGRVDPDSARFVCPHCRQEITDAQRARATWPPALGGTGRFASDLPAAEAARREYVGLKLNRLADPDVTVRELARRFAGARSEEELLTFFNKALGEPRQASRATVTLESVRAALQPQAGPVRLPGGELGARFIACGGDVQAPRHNPTVYLVAVAFAADGMAWLFRADRRSGWTAVMHWVRETEAELGGSRAGPRMLTLDAAWETGQVIGACREASVYGVDSGRVHLLPVRYDPRLNADNPAMLAPERKRINPMRPELGAIEYFYLHRHSWVDRAIRRVTEGRLKVICEVPEEFTAHLMSNVLRPVARQHGMDRDREEWVKPDEFRDDWLQALAYAEAGAALKLGLDTIHAVTTSATGEAPPPPERREGYMDRFRLNRGSWWARR